MQFIATLTHSPDNCWARPENEEKAQEFVGNLSTRAEQAGVVLHGAYVTPNEHRFTFVVEADEFAAVTKFFGPPLLQDHDGDITPVMSMEDAVSTVLEE